MKTQDTTIDGALGSIEKKLERVVAAQSEMLTRLRGMEEATPELVAPEALEDCGFLRRCELFEHARESTIAAARAAGKIRTLEPGDVLFRAGETCRTMFVVKSGVIEIQRNDDDDRVDTVCYLSAGNVIGKAAVFAGGKHRSTGRAPEGAEVLELPESAFARILAADPELAVALCRSLARRLEGVASSLDGMSPRHRQLQGRLRYFDLATVVQSLLSADEHTGVLTVNDERGKEIGSISILDSSVIAARCGRLTGPEAFNELFVQDLARAAFSFEETDDENELDDPDDSASIPGMSLLMEAARVKDECEKLISGRFADGEAVVMRVHDAALTWDDDSTYPVALALWRRLKGRARPVSELTSAPAHGTHAMIMTLAAMIDSGQLAIRG